MALITSLELESALPNLTAAQKADETAVIGAASALLASYCGTALESTAFSEVVSVDRRTRRIYLKNKHVTSISRVAQGPIQLALITNTDGNASRATVAFTVAGDPPFTSASGLTLTSYSGGTATTNSPTFASNTTVGVLVTAINAISGWSATLTDSSLASTACVDLDLDPGPRSAKGTGASLYGYAWDVEDYEADYLNGVLTLKYLWASNAGQGGDVHRPWGVRIAYTAGWLTIPADLKRACILTCQSIFENTPVAGTIKSESTPEYAYTLSDRVDLIPATAKTILHAGGYYKTRAS